MKKLFIVSAVSAITVGVIMVVGGLWAIWFTYHNVAQENIVTPATASIPNAPVRGPFTLLSQAQTIRQDTLKLTGGKTFAQMPRQVPKVDDQGRPVLDKDGQPVMVPNTARDIWITATTLTTALRQAVITYLFAGLVILLGIRSIWMGVVFRDLHKRP